MSRGRPSEKPAIKLDKWILESTDYDGTQSTIKFNKSKSPNGPYSIEHTPPKGYRQLKFKAEKKKAYGQQPVVMVFNTSNRSNAQTKMKVWTNENIDYILQADKLPGVPAKAVILDLGVGKSMISQYKQKYKLK